MPFNHKSLKEHVYQYLYEKINKGNLRPNNKINENQLCKDLDVSRTPIREALIQLEDEGYIERLPRRGFIVKEISQGKIREIYEILGFLEGAAASLAIDKLTDQEIVAMSKLIARMDEAIEARRVHEYFKLQRIFHDVYITSCGNNELRDHITSLKKRFVKKAYLLHENEDVLFKTLSKNNNEHKKILELFEKQDKAGVESYLRSVHWNFDNANIIISPFVSNPRQKYSNGYPAASGSLHDLKAR